MKKIILIFTIALILIACNNPNAPETLPQAKIVIDTNVNPIVFVSDDEITNWYNCSFIVKISETNGVGVDLSLIEVDYYIDQQISSSDTNTYPPRLNANSSKFLNYRISTSYIYTQIRVLVKGQDDNDHQIEKYSFFDVEYN